MKSKGQMFLIGAVVIVASLVIIRANMATSTSKYEIQKLKSNLENSIFDNVVNELNNTMMFSSNSPQEIDGNVFDFINFTESKMSGHSMTMKVLYVGLIGNKTINRMNVSVINCLDESIDVNISIPGQSIFKSGIVNYEKWDSNLTISAGSNYDVTLLYNSTTNDAATSRTETITINTKSNRDVYVGFVHVLLESEDATHAQKYEKSFKMKKS